MENKIRKKPSYGVQAPKDLLVFIPLAIITLILFLLFHKWWRFLYLGVFIYFAYTSVSILIGSTNWYREKLNNYIVKLCEVSRGCRILDVGCGSGSLSIAFAKYMGEGEVWGIDIWKRSDLSGNVPERTMENIKIEGVENIVRLKTADAREIPFPDDYFDAVVAVYAIHNIHSHADKAISEIFRVLKAGGIFVMVETGLMMLYLKHDIFPKIKEKIDIFHTKRYLLSKILAIRKGR
jgi:SAM-dependent methyltransferase